MVNLYEHQREALYATKNLRKVAYYHDMGLGKTFVGAEKLHQLNAYFNLIICQKSKINDWIEHFKKYYDFKIINLTVKREHNQFVKEMIHSQTFSSKRVVLIINYELIAKRSSIQKLTNFTLLLDESSMIQNEKTLRAKFVLKLKPSNVILLSGTPVSGRYEKLWTQIKLLDWNISKSEFWSKYVNYHVESSFGTPFRIVDGYKNVPDLKLNLRKHGAHFLKTVDVLTLPECVFQDVYVSPPKYYDKFKREKRLKLQNTELIGDTPMTKLQNERMLCGAYNDEKLKVLEDLLMSTEDRVIVFYNFNAEYDKIKQLCEKLDKAISMVNGKEKDLTAYNHYTNSVTLIQYAAGSKGLNLQLANKLIYYSPPLSCESWMQSQKRISRIGQKRNCFYYKLICKNSIESRIYYTLKRGVDYTVFLFENEH